MTATEPTQIEMAGAIIKALQAIETKVTPKDGRDWTLQIATSVGNLGDANDWQICSPHKGLFEPGWLYDLVWWRCDPNGYLSEVNLVLESEADGRYEKIKVDFEKLLVAKAPLKVMVFQGFNHSIPDIFAKMEQGIRAFERTSSDELYILAAFNNQLSKFEFRQVPSV